MNRCLSIVVCLLLAGCGKPRPKPFTINAESLELSDVKAAIDQAQDGDTVTLPAGTASWTERLNITKGITLQGQTTVDGAGTASPTVNDKTIILDDVPSTVQNEAPGIVVQLSKASQAARITGITFTSGARETTGPSGGYIQLICADKEPNKTMRVDHCHLFGLKQGKIFFVSGWVYGVIDHCVVDTTYTLNGGTKYSRFINGVFKEYGGPEQEQGNGAWADYGWFGTDKFFFCETNTVTSAPSGATDGNNGWRCVFRHSYFTNMVIGDHGSEGGPVRGRRAYEIYDNTFNWTVAHGSPISQRSGNSIIHDNTFTGTAGGSATITAPAPYRASGGVSRTTSFQPVGDSPLDVNDTDGAGHYVEGQPAHVYETGAATANSVNGSGTVVITDTSKHWTPNQWVDVAGGTEYQVTNTNPAAAPYLKTNYIISNTENTITANYYNATDRGPLLIWLTGDSYEITRILSQIDQTGRGKGDQINNLSTLTNGTQTFPATTITVDKTEGFADAGYFTLGSLAQVYYTGKTATTFTGCNGGRHPFPATVTSIPNNTSCVQEFNAGTSSVIWPHQIVEPSFSWNNVHAPDNTELKFDLHFNQTCKQGRDVYDLGTGKPADSYPAEITRALSPEVNGVQYHGDYVYPHPLVSGGGGSPSPAGSPSLPAATPTATEAPSVTPTAAPSATTAPSATVAPSPSPTATTTSTATATPGATGTPLILILRPGDTITITVPASP